MTHPFIRKSAAVPRSLPVMLLCGGVLALTGCGLSPSGSSAASPAAVAHTFHGTVYGGQQPISGASVALYAAGTTGIGSASRSMLTSPVTTNQNGEFDITGLYSCNPGDQVYLVGTGGNSGAGANSAIALMAALGPCATLLANQATTFINVNEVTTVGSVFALAPFMTGIQNVGADAAHANALAAAFATTQTLVNVANGRALTTSAGNGIVPQATIYSLANSIAGCINSTLSDSSCANLFAAVGSPTASETIGATLNVAKNPTFNPTGVFNLASATPPFQPTLSSAPATFALTVQHPSDVLLYHNDISRTGVQSYEQTLTPANVNSTQFGKLYDLTVDSYLYAQPLYVGGIGMPDGLVHDIVFAASSRGTVYAFDADGNNPPSGSLWSVNYIPSGERYAAAADYGCTNPQEAGIVGTPVIHRATQTMYFVTKSITTTGSSFYHRLHAVSLLDGSERAGSPQIISPTFAGTGDDAVNGMLSFNGKTQNQRSALLLTPNSSGGQTVWIAYASHCDIATYHGLMLGYDASALTLTASFNDTPNGGYGGYWGSNGGPAADAQGNIYDLGGNGTFDANTGGPDYGDSAVKLVPPAAGANSTQMTVADYFTPSNQATLAAHDTDLGGAEPLLISDPASGVAPHLLVASDKSGYIYLINTANMGKYDTGTNGIDGLNGDLQDYPQGYFTIYNYAFFNNTLYTGCPLQSIAFIPGTATTAGRFQTPNTAQQNYGYEAPVVSANGTANGIVWMISYDGNLRSFTADLSTALYDTSQAAGGRDTPPTYVKFSAPVIANGKVYMQGQGSLSVYGLLP
jgi:hypothetical protein